jgi:TetR/AcrR family transcriptional regulator, transcriptional repressor for nem operon
MRYSNEHKERARRRLLDSGGSHAKKHGFSGSGMDALAAAAGVTTGSLYKHFDGKSDLFAAVIEAELRRTAQLFSAMAPGDREPAAKKLAGYLSMHHVRHPESGCPLPSLTSEVARADESVRAAFQSGVLDIHAIVERFAASGDKAWALIAQSVGAVMLARAMLDEKVGRELLAAVGRAGQGLLGKPADSARPVRRGKGWGGA